MTSECGEWGQEVDRAGEGPGSAPARERLKTLAVGLARIHCDAPPAADAAEQAGAEAIARRIARLRARANELAPAAARRLERSCDLQQAFLDRRADAFEARVADGHIRATRAGAHDASREVAENCARLASRGHALQAEWLLAAYADAANDFSLYRVIDFYQRERGCELALAGARGAHELLSYAARTLPPSDALPAPVVVALGGLVASGKSTIAKAVARRLSAPRVVGDHLREFRLGATPRRPANEFDRLAAFEPGFADSVYATLFADADAVLGSGRGVVLDGGFPEARERRAARALAIRHALPFLFVECRVDESTALERLAARDAHPDGHVGWRDLYARYLARWQPVAHELPATSHLIVRGDGDPEAIAARVVFHLDAISQLQRGPSAPSAPT